MGFNRQDWDNAYKLTIDSSKVYEDLTDFPVSVVLGSGTGQTGFDVSNIFDELTVSGSSYSNRKKIALTTEYITTNSGLGFDFIDESDFVQEDSVSGTDFTGYKVLLNNRSTWSEQQKIQASDKQGGDYFGSSSAVYGDTLVVCAYLEDTGGADAGAAYVFTISGTTWVQQQKIQPLDIQAGDSFGQYSVSIYEDTIIVGAYNEDTGGEGVGSAYIFTRSGSTWTQQQKIQASDLGSNDKFSYSVSIYEDTVIVGSVLEDTGGTNAGAAYIFTRSGTVWTQQQKIMASNKGSYDYYGRDVGVYGDTAVVGASSEDTYGNNTGAVYIYTRSGSVWTEQQMVCASDPQDMDQFGYYVSIYENTMVVGCHLEDTGGSDAGAAYIFTKTGSTWAQQQKIQASDKQAGDCFGWSVCVYENTIIIGSYLEDSGGSDAGAAYIFTRLGPTWIQQQKIQSSDIQAGDSFGSSVAVYEDTTVIGASTEDTGSSNAGAAYIFTIPTENYPTNQPYYLHTSDTNNIPIYHVQTINSCTITNTQPEYTSIKGLISFDSRFTWKKWNGASWLTHTGGLTNLQTGNTITQIQEGLTNHHINGAGTYLDFAFDLATTYSGSTPEIDQITVTYLSAEELYTEIANWNSASGTASLWTKVPAVSATSDTELRIYYDKDQDDNLTHVGDTSEVLDIDYDVVVDIGSETYYDTAGASYQCVIKESDTSYKMWYSGKRGINNRRIIYCTSTNGTSWTNHQMVVDIESEGTYDTIDILSPYVIKESDTSYKMWYSGNDGSNWRIIYCTSTNGTSWTNHQMVVDIESEGTYDTNYSIFSHVIKESDTSYKMWYTGNDVANYRIIYCTSTNGTTWTNHQMIINIGVEGTYDTILAVHPCVIKESDTSYKMWYSGRDSTNYRIIYCTSTNGTTWFNHQMVVNIGSEGSYDSMHLRHPSVIKDYDNKYQMWYSGYNGSNYRIIYTESYLPTWDRTVSQAVWDNNFKGVWHMEQDPSGGSDCVLDSTLNINHGTPGGSMTSGDLVDGVVGKALDLDGSDDYMSIGTQPRLNSFTVSVIASFGNSGVIEVVLDSGWWTSTNNILIYKADTGVISTGVRQGASVAYTGYSTPTTLGVLYHVVLTSNGTTMYLYVNGGSVDSEGWTGSNTSSYTPEMGRQRGNNSLQLHGVLDDTRISYIARSAAWVSASYQSNWNTLITFSPAGTVSGTTHYFDGVVKELNTPVQRTLYLYRRDTGQPIGFTTSSGDGGYYIETDYTGNHFVVCVDDEEGIQYEDLIISRALPHSKGWTHEL